MPGGFIGVNTGLILLTQTESELASVLAHEITHVTQNHMARMLENQKNSLLMSLAALAVAIVAARSGSSSSDMVPAAIASAQALQVQNQLNFTRENEYEADRIGFQRLDLAGFDTAGAAALMERLQKASRFADGSVPTYLRTHPITYERIAEAQARAQSKTYRQVAGLARLPDGARAPPGATSDAPTRRWRGSTTASPSASTTARSRRATGGSIRCCATQRGTVRAREEGVSRRSRRSLHRTR